MISEYSEHVQRIVNHFLGGNIRELTVEEVSALYHGLINDEEYTLPKIFTIVSEDDIHEYIVCGYFNDLPIVAIQDASPFSFFTRS
jgi:hypothetical protein